jgi:crotonobetainyl-CoA:carnitine CoA-transferase CaiB-like acyl-CoA transferase
VCDELGLDDLRDLDTLERIDRAKEVRQRVTDAVAKRDLDDLLESLEGAPAAPALTRAEMLELPQFVHRDLVGLTTTDGIGVMGYPVRFEQHAARPPGRAPRAGEHQAEGFLPR